MLDILWYALAIYLIYQVVAGFLMLQKIKSHVNEATEIIKEQTENVIVVFERVKHNESDVILCYDNQNNFVAQGSSKEEVIELAQKRFPNKNIATYKREELQWIQSESNKN